MGRKLYVGNLSYNVGETVVGVTQRAVGVERRLQPPPRQSRRVWWCVLLLSLAAVAASIAISFWP